MIIYYLFELFIGIGNILTNLFGSVSILPFGTDDAIVEYWGWGAYILQAVWPLQAIVGIITTYLIWRIGVKVYQKIFGSRAVIN